MKDNPCKFVRDDRVAFAYGEMPAERADAFRAHLASCEACRQAVDELAVAAALCRKVRDMEVPAPGWRQAFDPGAPTASRSWVRRPIVWGPVLAGACILLLFVVLRPAPPPSPGVSPPPAPTVEPQAPLPLQVARVDGAVAVRRAEDGPVVPLATGTRLFAGDSIRTASASSTRLHLDDGSRLHLGEQSRLVLQGSGAEGDAFDLPRGNLVCLVRPRKGERPFSVTAGPGRIRVTGTLFALRLSDPAILTAGVAEGAVEVGRLGDPASGVVLGPGQQVTITADPQPLRPTRLSRRMRDLMRPLLPADGEPARPRPAGSQAGIDRQPPEESPETGTEPGEPARPREEPAPLPDKQESIESVEALVNRLHQDTRWIFDELRIQMERGNWDRVLRYLKDYLADPDSPNRDEAVFLQAVCLEKMGSIRKAHQTYREYLLRWPAGQRAREAKHGLVRTRHGLR